MSPEQILAGIRSGNYHQGGIRCLRLLRMEGSAFEAIRAEAIRLTHDETPSRAGERGHVTQWVEPAGQVLQYSLYNGSGRTDDFSSDHDLAATGKRFHFRGVYPALGNFIGVFPDLINFRVNVLGPGAELPAHEEHALIRTRDGLVGARLRFHLPVLTNAESELTLDGQVFVLQQGEIHLVNHGCVHAAGNRGATRRVHLVWDLLLTRRTFECMFVGGSPPGMSRIPEDEWEPHPVRNQEMGAFKRIPPRITPMEAGNLSLLRPLDDIGSWPGTEF